MLGEYASCWTSLDLVRVFMQLLNTSDFARRICASLWSNGRSVTVMMYALVQLDGPWTETYIEFTASVLVHETMVVRKYHQGSFLKEVMERFLMKNANAAMKTVLKAYSLGAQQMQNYNFFKTLYLTCCTIPQFVSMFANVPGSPMLSNLQILIHFVYLHCRKQEGKVLQAFHSYSETAGPYLIDLLLRLLDLYLKGRYVVIDNFLDAKYTLMFLVQCESRNLSAELVNHIDTVHNFLLSSGREGFNRAASMIESVLYDLSSVASLIPDLQQLAKASTNFQLAVAQVLLLLFQTILPIDPLWTNLLNLTNRIVFSGILTASSIMELVNELLALAPGYPDSKFLQQVLGEWFRWFPKLQITKKLLMQVSELKMADLYHNLLQWVTEPVKGPVYNGENVEMNDPVQMQMQMQMQMQSQMQSQMQMNRNLGVQERMMSPTNDQLSELQNRQREIQKEIVPVTRTIDYIEPDERRKHNISMLINNMTESNLSSKMVDLSALLEDDMEKWFVDFLVRSRVERQDNYHTLYLSLVNYLVKVKGARFLNQVIDTSIQVTQELLTSDLKTLNEQHAFLKNMGGWLGLLTIGQDICLSQLHLNLTDVLLTSFYHKRLWYVYEFVCFLLRGCKESQVIKPPQPWLAALLSLLKEIYMVPGIKEHFARLFKNFLEYMKYREDSIQFVRSELYLAIPDVTDNQDFNPTAKQSEVYNYFLKNYPRLKDLQAKSHGFRDLVNKEIREFVPRGFQPHAAPMNYEMQGLSAGEVNIGNVVESFILNLNRYHFCDKRAIMVYESVYYMFLRDLVQVQDNQKLEGYLKNAALSLIDSLLLLHVTDWEANLLHLFNAFYRNQGWSLEEYFKWVQVYAEVIYQNLRNKMWSMVYQVLKTRILDLPREYFATSKNDRSPTAGGMVSNTQMALKERFRELVSESDMTENEKTPSGELTALQESVYAPSSSTLTFQDVMLSQEALHDCFIKMYYQYIMHELEFFFGCMVNVERLSSANFEEVFGCINRLKEDAKLETHIPAQDKCVIDLLLKNMKHPRIYSDIRVFELVIRIIRILIENKFPNLPQSITQFFLDVAVQLKQPQLLIPAMVMLAANQMLDLPTLDDALQSFLAHSFANYLVKLFVFLLITDLVLMRELVTVDQLPLTVETLEKLAASEGGKEEVEIEGNRMSAFSLVESLRKKQSVIAMRIHMNQTLESDVCKMLQRKIDSVVPCMNSESDVLYYPERMDELVELVDSVVQVIGDDGAYITFYLLLWKAMRIYLVRSSDSSFVGSLSERALYISYSCDLVIVLFGLLVHRESPQNRQLVFKAELDMVQALLFEMHDLNIRNFHPVFFLRVLSGLFKEIVLAETDSAVRTELALQFCSLLLVVSPAACPAFLYSWMQLLTMPPILHVLIAEKNEQLVHRTGELVVSLFSLMQTPFAFLLSNCTNDGLSFLSFLRTSFPGFLAARCSFLIRYLHPEACRYVLDDVPPEFNFEKANQDADTFLARVLPLRAEPEMAYQEELDRAGLTEAVEGFMRDKPTQSAILSGLSKHSAVLRFVVMFWVMEEETLQKTAGKSGVVRSAAECITQLVHSAQSEMQMMRSAQSGMQLLDAVVNYLLEYVRFPCKETSLYLRTLMSLAMQMSKEMRQWVLQHLKKKPLFKHFELKQFNY